MKNMFEYTLDPKQYVNICLMPCLSTEAPEGDRDIVNLT